MNTGVHVYFELEFSLDKCLGGRFFDHMVTLLLFFKENIYTFPHNAAPINNPSNSVGGFLCLPSVSIIYYLQTF